MCVCVCGIDCLLAGWLVGWLVGWLAGLPCLLFAFLCLRACSLGAVWDFCLTWRFRVHLGVRDLGFRQDMSQAFRGLGLNPQKTMEAGWCMLRFPSLYVRGMRITGFYLSTPQDSQIIGIGPSLNWCCQGFYWSMRETKTHPKLPPLNPSPLILMPQIRNPKPPKPDPVSLEPSLFQTVLSSYLVECKASILRTSKMIWESIPSNST